MAGNDMRQRITSHVRQLTKTSTPGNISIQRHACKIADIGIPIHQTRVHVYMYNRTQRMNNSREQVMDHSIDLSTLGELT